MKVIYDRKWPSPQALVKSVFEWGLVAGKSNAIYAWDEPISDGSEPVLWFHDIFRNDGSPFDRQEIEYIKKLRKWGRNI